MSSGIDIGISYKLYSSMILLQRCTSSGSSIDSDIESDIDCILDNQNTLFRHRCVNLCVFYYKNQMESKVWGVYNDKDDITRCKHCGGKWGLYIEHDHEIVI